MNFYSCLCILISNMTVTRLSHSSTAAACLSCCWIRLAEFPLCCEDAYC